MIHIESVPYDDPDARALIELVQAEYVVRYGGRDTTPVDPLEFAPPDGLFLVARDGTGVAVGCGGWRAHRPDAAEIKRMFVRLEHRRHGVGQVILVDLERRAAAAGYRTLELFTGSEQPEALAMYVAAGYTPVTPFGPYAGEPRAYFYGKALPIPTV